MLSITYNGVTYNIPTAGEQGWADTINAYLQALGTSAPASTVPTKAQAAPSLLLFGNSASASSDTNAVYLNPGFASGAPGSTVLAIPLPFACKVSNLRVHLSAAWAASAGGATFTVVKNGSNQTVAASLVHGSQNCQDTSNSFTAVAGDVIAIRLDTAGGTNAAMANPIATLELTIS